MSNRHLSRTIAMQTLFEWDFRGRDAEQIAEILQHNMAEFAPDFDDEQFSAGLVHSVVKHREEIDTLIGEFAPEWPIAQITIVDRNVLRIGIFELVIAQDIPARVAINEAIELAKSFGGESSGRFVNGVLGALYRDLLKQGKVKGVDKDDPKIAEQLRKTQSSS
jgi:transcription antitermination protein NusB